jgi:NTE family protein
LKEPPRTVIGKALHAITLMIAWQLMYELERLAEDIHVHLMPTLCPLAVSPFDFSVSGELIERAAQSSKKWIEEGGLTRRALPRELAPHRH